MAAEVVHTYAVPDAALGDELLRVPNMRLDELPGVVNLARAPEHVVMQESVIRSCLQRILRDGRADCSWEPRHEQVVALRRLIFCRGDVLLIAKTGFGKSLIFQAFSILTTFATL
jgi:hypothetical protein